MIDQYTNYIKRNIELGYIEHYYYKNGTFEMRHYCNFKSHKSMIISQKVKVYHSKVNV